MNLTADSRPLPSWLASMFMQLHRQQTLQVPKPIQTEQQFLNWLNSDVIGP